MGENRKAKIHMDDRTHPPGADGVLTLCGRIADDVTSVPLPETVTCELCRGILKDGRCADANPDAGKPACARVKGHTGRHACKGQSWDQAPAPAGEGAGTDHETQKANDS